MEIIPPHCDRTGLESEGVLIKLQSKLSDRLHGLVRHLHVQDQPVVLRGEGNVK